MKSFARLSTIFLLLGGAVTLSFVGWPDVEAGVTASAPAVRVVDPTPAPQVQPIDTITKAILVRVNGEPGMVVFIFHDGSDVTIGAAECSRAPDCDGLIGAAMKAGKIEFVDLRTRPDFSKTPGTKV